MTKQIWWNHFLDSKKFWACGTTLKRLERAQMTIFNDRWIWDDVLMRHGGKNMEPHTMQRQEEFTYLHLMGNLAGSVSEILYRES